MPNNESYRVYLVNMDTSEEQYKNTTLGDVRVIFNNVYPATYTLRVKPIDNGYTAVTSNFNVKSGEPVNMGAMPATLVAPEISNATYTTNVEIIGFRLASSEDRKFMAEMSPEVSRGQLMLHQNSMNLYYKEAKLLKPFDFESLDPGFGYAFLDKTVYYFYTPLIKKYDRTEVKVVFTDEPEKVKAFIKKRGFTFPVKIARYQLPDALYTRSIPTTFLISKSGKIMVKETGAANWGGDKMEEIVNDLISE